MVSRLLDGHVVVYVDPRVGGGFGEHSMGAPGTGIDEIKVKIVLGAIQYFSPEDTVTDPSKARNVNLRVVGERDPLLITAGRAHHTQAHDRVGIAGLGILLPVHSGMRGHPVGDWIGGYPGFVHVQEGDVLAIRGPEVITAHV